MTPRLAVVIPAFNASQTITASIESAKACGADQIIVINDGSSDTTVSVAEKAGATVIEQDNAGASVARQNGARHVASEYVIFLDSDDELVPDGVKGSIAALDADSDIAVSAGVLIGFSRSSGTEQRFPIRYSPVTTESLLQQGFGPWPPCNAVVRVSALRRAENADPEALHPRFADDYELLIRLSRHGKIAVRDEPTCRYSMDGGKSVVSAARAIATKEEIRKHYSEAYGIDITLMTERQIKRSAQARIARAHKTAKNWPGFVVAIARWGLLDPIDSIRRVAGRRPGLAQGDDS